MASKAEKRHMGRVAELGCVLCRRLGLGDTPAQVHHVREGQGMAQRADNFLTIPLCPSCHTGPRGIHGDKGLLKQAKCTELDLLADVIEALV